jgi:hypothetical protein
VSNVYVISSVVENTSIDTITVTGTVNGTPVTVVCWISALGNAMASAVGFQNYFQPLMLAAYNKIIAPTNVVPPTPGFTV